jgi:ribosomal protein S16
MGDECRFLLGRPVMEYDPEASAAQEKSSEINEQAWKAWLEKGADKIGCVCTV